MILLRDIEKDYEKFIDQEVEIAGWIKNSRFQKNLGFIELNDGTQFKPVQVVVDKDVENFEEISKLGLSSAIIVKGKLVIVQNLAMQSTSSSTIEDLYMFTLQ